MGAITAADYLRATSWIPVEIKHMNKNPWGAFRFSIGLWVGHTVTPNNLVNRNGWDNTRKMRTKYVGALDILNYSYKVPRQPGERVSYEGEEPAQVLKCPCCSSLLAIPFRRNIWT
jgi:hypothetical protein